MLRHHNYYTLCDTCGKETSFFCAEDNVKCEDCYNEQDNTFKSKSLKDQLMQYANDLSEYNKNSLKVIENIKKVYKL